MLAVSALTYACSDSGGGCGGCGGEGEGGEPYVFEGTVEDHVVFQGGQIHVTQSGLDNISGNLDVLIGTLMDGEGLSFCLEAQDVGLGFGICGAQVCDDGTTGCQLDIGLEDVRIVPQRTASPTDDRLRIELELVLDERIQTTGVTCNIDLSTGEGMPVAANIYLNLDGPPWERVHVELPEDAFVYDINDIGLNINGGLAGACGLLNGLTGTITGLLGDQIDGMIADAIGPALCKQCTENADCGPGATCDGEVCIADGTEECVPLPLGVEMAFDLGDALADFAPGLEAELGILAYVANYADAMGPPGSGLAYEGVDLGMEVGFFAEADACVPYAPAPPTDRIAKSPSINADETPGGEPFGVGIGVHRTVLDLAGWAIYRSGALCISVGSDTIEQVSTGTFSVLLPSLGTLVDGENRPMYLQLRPQKPITFELGAGTVDEDGTIIDPLLTAMMEDLEIDFYVFTEDRYVRLLTLRSTLAIPLALSVNDANQIEIALGDLSAALQDIEALHAELLSEDDAVAVATVLPSLIGALLPTLVGDALEPIDLPEIAEGVSLVIPSDGITSVDARQMLAIFADVAIGTPVSKSASLRPGIAALEVVRADRADVEAMLAARAEGAPLDIDLLTPEVRMTLEAMDNGAPAEAVEFSTRVNGGAWRTWRRGGELVIRDPAMALSGTYTIDVRARYEGEPTPSVPYLSSTSFTVDYVPPRVEMVLTDNSVAVVVEDQHSPENVAVRYRIANGEWRRADARFELDLGETLAVGETAELVVEATDAFGNRAVEKSIVQGGFGSAESPAEDGVGCSASGGAASWGGLLFGLLALLGLRRRPAGAMIAVAALALAVGACGNNKNNKVEQDVCDPACGAGEECVNGVCEALVCVEDADCGEGFTCLDGSCVGPCTEDEDCPTGAICEDGACVVGERCVEDTDCGEGEYCEAGECLPYECTEDSECGDCGEFERPYCDENNECACEAPCAEGCAEGSLCCESRDECVELVAECDAKECDIGFHVQPIADPVFDPDTCAVTVECDCVEMPPLPLGNTGVYLDIGVSVDGEVSAVAAYNSTYGDLMVSLIDGESLSWEYVDGLSDDTRVTGSLNGPRGGVATAGPNVGLYPSIAVGADGSLHVAYYSASGDPRRSLFYAHGTPASGGYDWTMLAVDTTDGAGHYTDIELDEAGLPVIGYVVPAARTETSAYESQIRIARATSTTPTTAEDWAEPLTVVAVENGAPCGNSCVGRQVCRLDTNTCSTALRDSECEGGCGDNGCFENEEAPNSCAETAPGKPEGPAVLFDGIGLFLDMEFLPEGMLGFAYYDRTNGNLMYAETGAAEPALVEGQLIDGQVFDEETESWVDTGDVGWFPDLYAAGDASVWIAYGDATAGSMRAANVGEMTTAPVDDGVRCYEFDGPSGECIQPLNLRVGYDGAIAEDDAGLHMVYQDATWHEILESPLGPFGWDLPGSVAGGEEEYEGAYGFYLGHGVDADGRFVVSYRLNQRMSPPVRDTVVIRR